MVYEYKILTVSVCFVHYEIRDEFFYSCFKFCLECGCVMIESVDQDKMYLRHF